MRKLVLAASVLALSTSAAMADNTDQATISVGGTIIASLTATNAGDITMPDLVSPDAAGTATSVEITCQNNSTTPSLVTYGGNGGNPFADGFTGETAVAAGSQNSGVGNDIGTCGVLNITGESGFFYQASAAVTTAATTVANVQVASASCADEGGATIGGGTIQANGGDGDTLFCGATVEATDAATAGAYTDGVITVTVIYD